MISTPYFLFNKKNIDLQLRDIKEAFVSHWNNYIVSYSVKTNSLPALSNYLMRQGLFAEVVSEDEFNLVKLCGFPNDKIISNGPVKNEEWLSYLLSNNLLLNIDSFSEIKVVVDYAKSHPKKIIKVGIRANLDVESVFQGESKGGEVGSRFGFSYLNEDFYVAVSSLMVQENIHINGLHLHISTHTRQVEIYEWIAHQFLELVHKYKLKDIEYLDIGGGFFGGVSGDRRNWNNYIRRIATVLKSGGFLPQNLKLIIEPGVSLLAGCFDYYTTVKDVKNIKDLSIVVLDGSRIHIDPIFNRKKHLYHISYKSNQKNNIVEPKQVLVGCTCMENDQILKLQNENRLRVGDLVCFEKVGAYTMTLSPLFIHYFPSVYMYDIDDKLLTLRHKWGSKEMIQGSNLNIIE